jgi:serine/threonine protein kinase
MALLSELPCRFGKFVLIDRIGRGGMADVFRGMLQGADGFTKECAVKVILPSLAEDPHFVRMFIDEARVAVWLNHPNVVQIYDLGQFEGQYFIAMEYVSGKDLLDLLAARARTKLRIPVAVAVYIVIQILRGLDFAHHATSPIGEPLTIVHRDVSPSNILLSYQGLVKVADFGIAKSGLQSNLTEGGTHKGKMGYMSPEQVTGNDIDLRSDLFAAGVVLFELLTMSRLFKAPNDLDVMLKIRDVSITEELTRLRDVPIALRDILLRALSRSADDRFASGADFAEALQEFADHEALDLGPHLLAKVLQDTFAESVVAEAKRRRTSQEVLPAPVPAPAAPPDVQPRGCRHVRGAVRGCRPAGRGGGARGAAAGVCAAAGAAAAFAQLLAGPGCGDGGHHRLQEPQPAAGAHQKDHEVGRGRAHDQLRGAGAVRKGV